MGNVKFSTLRRRLIRTLTTFTITSLIIGFMLGVVVGKSFVEVSASDETISAIEPQIAAETISEEQPVIVPEEKTISLGVYKLSAYCKENYPHICNNGDSSTTATGTTPTVGRTVAVDPNVIPYGSEIIINGHTYIAEDCGGAIKGNRIDILFETHQEALAFGIRYAEVEYCEPS